MPYVLYAGLLGVVVSTLTAQWLRLDPAALHAGLYGFNGVLVGLALATFIAPGPLLWAYVVLGGAVSVVAMAATVNVCKTWSMPALTFPFVLVTWLLLLATYGFAGLSGNALPAAGVVAPFTSMAATRVDAAMFVQATLHSISQVFLKGSAIAALLFLAGLAVNSFAAAGASIGSTGCGRAPRNSRPPTRISRPSRTRATWSPRRPPPPRARQRRRARARARRPTRAPRRT